MRPRGICLWITGLPASGKTTTSRELMAQLSRVGLAPRVLDGDEIRSEQPPTLGFSQDDRMEHVRQMAVLASEAVRAGGIVLVTCISPYAAGRAEARSLISPHGLFVEIFADAPLEVCETRDPKGLYRRARLGEIENFTGVSDPYEIPQSPDLRIDTVGCTPTQNAIEIWRFLYHRKPRLRLPLDFRAIETLVHSESVRPRILATETPFLCPQCRGLLPARLLCECGFVPGEYNGILDFMTNRELTEKRPFLEAYEKVRADEQWGSDDLDLPFRPLLHRDIWNIRQRTFRMFGNLVANVNRGFALDVGAGNCWMTRYLDRWGFDAVAVDINAGTGDGLGAGQKFIDEGAHFLRVRAGMERLPFASGRIRLLAINASFHYASDFLAVLSEFKRVLTQDGTIVILDTPFYENAADGERMVAERVAVFRRKYDIPDALAGQARYLSFTNFETLMRSLNLKWRLFRAWPGLLRKCVEIRGTVTGRRVAQFPVAVIKKRHE